MKSELEAFLTAYEAERRHSADLCMSLVMRLRGEEEIDVEAAQLAARAYLRAWWRVTRCKQLIDDLGKGASEAEVAEMIPGTPKAEADYEVWLGWMREMHPEL